MIGRRSLLAAALIVVPACAGTGTHAPAGPLAADGAVGSVAASSSCAPADSVARSGNPDISIRATIRADELRVDSQPAGGVRMGGTALRSAVSCDERVNLDRPVRAGQTYRNVEIRYHMEVRIDSALARAMSTAAPDSARRP